MLLKSFKIEKNEFISQIWNDLFIVSLYINEDWKRKNGNIHVSINSRNNDFNSTKTSCFGFFFIIVGIYEV